MERFNQGIDVAMKRKKADLVLKNASYINVFTQTIEKGDIAIYQGEIVGIGEYDGIKEIDCQNLYVAPGFIDSHVHIESSMVTPEVFSHIVISKGVTTVVADPHEIANVMGKKGIDFMLKNSLKGVMDIQFMLPSCVPAVSFEDNGATLKASDLAKFSHHPKVLGLGEVMDVHAVTSKNKIMLDKINLMKKARKAIDGHSPQIDPVSLNAYIYAGVKTDHECTTASEALIKVKKGMYVLLREGSAAKDLVNLLGAINKENYHQFLFCTDDRHIEDLLEEGSIDNSIRLAIKNGIDPIMAYTIASYNAALCYQLRDRGAIAPGYMADLVVFEDLEKLAIECVIKNGKIYDHKQTSSKVKMKKSIHMKACTNFSNVVGHGDQVHVIKVMPGKLTTEKVTRHVTWNNGQMQIESDDIVNKISVIERHKNTGKYFTGFIEGLGLKDGAIAQTIAHDSHNIIVVGSNDVDMILAKDTLVRNGGGIVFVSQGKVLASLELPIAGIITDEKPEVLLSKVKELNRLAKAHGVKEGIDPYITLSFMALPVIPDLKITPRGLFDYSVFNFISLFE